MEFSSRDTVSIVVIARAIARSNLPHEVGLRPSRNDESFVFSNQYIFPDDMG